MTYTMNDCEKLLGSIEEQKGTPAELFSALRKQKDLSKIDGIVLTCFIEVDGRTLAYRKYVTNYPHMIDGYGLVMLRIMMSGIIDEESEGLALEMASAEEAMNLEHKENEDDKK